MISRAALDIELDETPIKAAEIPRLTELFLTGTTTNVMPVVKLDDKPVGKGKPGELTRTTAARARRESRRRRLSARRNESDLAL